MKIKTRILSVVLGALLAGSSIAKAQDLVLGVFLPTTGNWAPIGTDMRNGLELAAEGATVRNQNVRLIIEDTTGNPGIALRKAQKLVMQDRVPLLIGGASSAVVLAIGAQASKLNVPLVSTNAAAGSITGEHCNRYVFRASLNDVLTNNAMRVLMQQRKDLLEKNWFVLYHDFAYGTSNKAAFSKIENIKIAGEAGRPLGTADWSSAIAQIQSSDASGIYLSLAVGDDLTAVVNQIRSYGINLPLLISGGVPESLLGAMGENGVGIITAGLASSWTQEEANPQLAAFVKKYVAKYNTVPGFQAMTSYAGMQLTLAALNAAPELTTDAIIKSLETTTADTILGPLSIRKHDHQLQVGAYSAEVKALQSPKYGVTTGWAITGDQKWDQIKYGEGENGCSGL